MPAHMIEALRMPAAGPEHLSGPDTLGSSLPLREWLSRAT